MHTEEYIAPGGGFTLTRHVFDSPEEERAYFKKRDEDFVEEVRTATTVCRTCGHRVKNSWCSLVKCCRPPLFTCGQHETVEVLQARLQVEREERERQQAERQRKMAEQQEAKKLRQQEKQQARRKKRK